MSVQRRNRVVAAAFVGTAIGMVGLFNIMGTYAAGSLGQRFLKTQILAFIYFMRAVAIALFLYFPLSDTSVYLFAMVMGLLWLSTVPPTSAVIAQIFGEHMRQ